MKFEVEIPLTDLERIDALWRFLHQDVPTTGLRTRAQLEASGRGDPEWDRGVAYAAILNIVKLHAGRAFEAAMAARGMPRRKDWSS